jgi:hypothetical protein
MFEFKGFVDCERVDTSIFYELFKVFFIFTGLATQASSINLIVYKFNERENLKMIGSYNNILLLTNDKKSTCSLNLIAVTENKHKFTNLPQYYSFRSSSSCKLSNWKREDEIKKFPRYSATFNNFNQISSRSKRNSI